MLPIYLGSYRKSLKFCEIVGRTKFVPVGLSMTLPSPKEKEVFLNVLASNGPTSWELGLAQNYRRSPLIVRILKILAGSSHNAILFLGLPNPGSSTKTELQTL